MIMKGGLMRRGNRILVALAFEEMGNIGGRNGGRTLNVRGIFRWWDGGRRRRRRAGKSSEGLLQLQVRKWKLGNSWGFRMRELIPT